MGEKKKKKILPMYHSSARICNSYNATFFIVGKRPITLEQECSNKCTRKAWRKQRTYCKRFPASDYRHLLCL